MCLFDVGDIGGREDNAFIKNKNHDYHAMFDPRDFGGCHITQRHLYTKNRKS